MKLEFVKCPCGNQSCSTWHIKGFGSFVQGSGFTSAEAVILRKAFEAQEQLETLKTIINGETE